VTDPYTGETTPTFPSSPEFAFTEQSAAIGGSTFAAAESIAGYIDSAIVRSQLRFRFEGGYGINRSDRAEFLYTTWDNANGGKAPTALGFTPERNIDYELLSVYVERAFGSWLSAFVDLGVLMNNPLDNANHSGIGDTVAGFKVALVQGCDSTLTFQLKNYIPTGDPDKWLTAGHYSIEPGFLYYRRLTDDWTLEAELRDWISVGGAVDSNGNDYAGNVLRYGVGLGYNVIDRRDWRVTPIVELVGWSVLEGQVVDAPLTPNQQVIDADGDTIVNIKVGTRIANGCGGSLYGGWGHALTDDRWYRDIFRLEFRKMF
jgi:hypothetical protein